MFGVIIALSDQMLITVILLFDDNESIPVGGNVAGEIVVGFRDDISIVVIGAVDPSEALIVQAGIILSVEIAL